MATAGNGSGNAAGSSGNGDNVPTTNPNVRVDPTDDNPRGYPPFDMRLVPNYTNNQLTYYYTSGAIPAAEQARFQQLMKQRKTSLELLGWNGASDESDGPSTPEEDSTIPVNSDSDCPAPLPGHKGIKINPSDIPKLAYNSTVAQYNNWLADVKTGFDGDPARFPTSRQKIILASITLDEQLKTTLNSAAQDNSDLSHHWRKFERWLRDVVLHGGSDKLKLSKEFTAARQLLKEDPNQFYLRLFNLGIQSGRTVSTEDYRTRLLKPLQNLMDQHDREYPTIQQAVTHAGRLWQTLDREKVRLELKEEKEKAQNRYENFGQRRRDDPRPQGQNEDRRSSRRNFQRDSRQESRDSHRPPRRDRNRPKPSLSTSERDYRKENHLCFKCGLPDHSARDCKAPFNPERAPVKDDKTKSQSYKAWARKRTRTQALRASSPSDNDKSDHNVHTTTDDEDYESDSDRPRKRSKN
jgi:hypothetical protein